MSEDGFGRDDIRRLLDEVRQEMGGFDERWAATDGGVGDAHPVPCLAETDHLVQVGHALALFATIIGGDAVAASKTKNPGTLSSPGFSV